MKITFKRQYRKPAEGEKPSSMVFVYGINGTPEEIADYKAVKGAKFREDKDTKEPLFFGNRLAPSGSTIVKTEKEKADGTKVIDWRIDTTEADQIKSFMEQGYAYEHAKDLVKGL
jgi:hypothetical protein